MESAPKKNSVIDIVWDFFTSVKLAIVLFILIAGTSIIGTVIEQNAEDAKNLAVLAKLVGESAAPGLLGALKAMGFVDMYHSWWFTAILVLFNVNLIICSLDRLPPIWKIVREKAKPLNDDQFKAFPIKKEFNIKAGHDEAASRLDNALRGLGFKNIERSQSGNTTQLYAQKGAVGRLGVYITHLSIVIILAGAVAGMWFGFNGFLMLPEGVGSPMAFASRQLTPAMSEEFNVIYDAFVKSNGDVRATASELGVAESNLRTRMRILGIEPLGFIVKCEDFDVAYYEGTNAPKEFASQLSVYENGKLTLNKMIEVNDPLVYNGYTFYQSSYDMVRDTGRYVYRFKVTPIEGESKEISVKLGEGFKIPGTKTVLSVSDFSPALMRNEITGAAETFADSMINPAVAVVVDDGKDKYKKWILRREPATWDMGGAGSVQLLDVWGSQRTGLQVRKDPGVSIVYAGCIFMSVGLYMAFFISHKRIWVRIGPSKGASQITVAASSHKYKEGFDRALDDMIVVVQKGEK